MNEIQLKIYEIVKANIEKEESYIINADTDLITVGLDSIAFIKCIVALEEEFGIEISDEDLWMPTMNTIQKMTDKVETALVRSANKKWLT